MKLPATLRVGSLFAFFLIKLAIFRLPDGQIAVTSKRLKVETSNAKLDEECKKQFFFTNKSNRLRETGFQAKKLVSKYQVV